MASFAIYGGYSHRPGTVNVSVVSRVLETEQQQPYATLKQVTLDGVLLSTHGSISTQASALESAYAVNGRNFSFFHHTIRSSSALGGVRVLEVAFPDGGRSAYVTTLPFRIILEAEVPVTNAANILRSFSETLEFAEPDPIFGFTHPINGLSRRQRTRTHSFYRATQAGNAVGYLRQPNLATITRPIWPALLLSTERPALTVTSPKPRFNGRGFDQTDFSIQWRWQFASALPFTGQPHQLTR
jgi:hypothetical protein